MNKKKFISYILTDNLREAGRGESQTFYYPFHVNATAASAVEKGEKHIANQETWISWPPPVFLKLPKTGPRLSIRCIHQMHRYFLKLKKNTHTHKKELVNCIRSNACASKPVWLRGHNYIVACPYRMFFVICHVLREHDLCRLAT